MDDNAYIEGLAVLLWKFDCGNELDSEQCGGDVSAHKLAGLRDKNLWDKKKHTYRKRAQAITDWHREQGLIVRSQYDCTCPRHNTDHDHILAK